MRHALIAIAAIAAALGPGGANLKGLISAHAQTVQPPVAPSAVASETAFTRAELETLLKPIALYPDALLAQLLPASAYPLDIVQATRWMEKNKAALAKGDFSGVDAMPWDPSVKALVRFPDLIKKLNENLDWTSDLGDAFVHQPEDVATIIQGLRALAERGGALRTTPQQKVVKKTEGTREVIYIEPTEPEVIYVPAYDSAVVYDPVGSTAVGGLIGFGTGILVGSLINNNYWNWGSGIAYPPVWPGYPSWRPPYPGYRPGMPPPAGWRPGGGNINIGNDINIGGGNNLVGNSKPWRPDSDRYRPGQGTKPGLARPGGPGGAGRPGGPRGPGGAGGVGGIGGPGGPGGVGGVGGLGGAGGAAIGGAIGGAVGGAIGARPGAGPRPSDGRPGNEARPGGGERPGGAPRPETRPAGGAGRQARPSQPQARPSHARATPQARPAPKPTAFDRVNQGAGAAQFGNRGAASRAQMGIPRGGGGGPAMRRGGLGGGGAAMRGGGGGGRVGGGGGGRGGRR